MRGPNGASQQEALLEVDPSDFTCRFGTTIQGENMSEETKTTPGSRRTDELIIKAFAKLDRVALGLAVGIVVGISIFAATVFLVAKGGDQIGPNLSLLGQYFLGYTVTWKGSIIGLAYGFAFGFILGWLTAFLRNSLIALHVYTVKLRANISSINNYMDDL